MTHADEDNKKKEPEKTVSWDEFVMVALTLINVRKTEMLQRESTGTYH